MEIIVLEPDAWAERVAAAWAERLTSRPGLSMCCPTGETPRPVYDAVVELFGAGQVSFARADVFLLDEYLGLPPGHPASCESMLRDALVDHVDLDPSAFHLFEDPNRDPGAAIHRMESDLGEAGLDLAMVGLGLNGHVGMNEPGTGASSLTRVVELTESTRRTATGYGAGASPPTHGLTIGMKRLMDASEVWLLVTGGHKAQILRRVLTDEPTPEVTASLLRSHPGLTVFADSDAATELPGSTVDLRT